VEGTRRDGRHAHATARHGGAGSRSRRWTEMWDGRVPEGRGEKKGGRRRSCQLFAPGCVLGCRAFLLAGRRKKNQWALARSSVPCSSTTCAILARYSTRRSAASHHHSPLGGAVAVAVVESEAADMNILAQQRRQRTGQRIDLLNTPARHELARSGYMNSMVYPCGGATASSLGASSASDL
jgi:hypothetical protein